MSWKLSYLDFFFFFLVIPQLAQIDMYSWYAVEEMNGLQKFFHSMHRQDGLFCHYGQQCDWQVRLHPHIFCHIWAWGKQSLWSSLEVWVAHNCWYGTFEQLNLRMFSYKEGSPMGSLVHVSFPCEPKLLWSHHF